MDKNMALMVTGFVVLLMGAIFSGVLPTVASESTNLAFQKDSFDISSARANTNLTIYENESGNRLTLSKLRTGWKSQDSQCALGSNLVVRNGSSYALTLNTHYNFTEATGVISFKNGAGNPFMNASAVNTTTAEYNYCPDGYVTQAWGRTAINVSYGLYAIGVLLIAVGIFFIIAKNNGISDM